MRLSLLAPLAFSLVCAPMWAQDAADVSPESLDEETAAPEEEQAEEEPDSTKTEVLVTALKGRFEAVAALLGQVQDARSAEALRSEVSEHFSALMQTDASALETADEEELAEAFAPVDVELARLEKEDFYGVEALRAVFADSEESGESDESGYCFPLGPLDFLRGSEKNHVCPRKEGVLPLMDWGEE